MTVRIRMAELEDAEKLLDMVLRAYLPIRKLGINFAAATADINLARDHIKNNMVYIMEDEGNFKATIALRMPWGKNPGPAGFPHIGWFAVNPDIVRKNVGSTLLDFVEQKIIVGKLKSPAVTLGTAENHPWLVDMYEKKGYQKIGRADLGKGHITVYLRKILMPDLFEKLKVK
ncbi:GNAT family N-acetyltransferase [Clostridium fermenticellae]|uniref:GNAT family N-acetyltransferase n=1 Tax=Clostridium fermenticellae TaxID=2068654 RepID=A0A386H5P4_9CLOT|nr:GNAT family N-acetyltransferase [Clostridium fermenticellae]AYD40934.1 GNAT family N-acetyltransferase [Clostridium fermenticellae]